MFKYLIACLFLFVIQLPAFSQESTEITCAHARMGEYSIAKMNQTTDFGDYDVKLYFLDIEADNQSVHVKGKVTIKAQVITEGLTQFVVELVDELTIDSVYVNGAKSTFLHSSGTVAVNLLSARAANELVDVTFFYEGTPPTGGFFSGISNAFSGSWGNQITWTLSEPLNAKDWFPCKQVLEDKADSAYIFITVPDNLKAGSNGLLTNIKPLENNRVRYEWKTRYPIAYYLLSMTIGAYVEYNIYAYPEGADSILIQNYIYDNPATLPNFKPHIDQVASMIELFSNLFGLYPFHEEKYGHCMAPFGGGMEHQTMTSLGFFNFTLDAHELGHQWFGDHVTCATWRDIWINEGFARYTEYLAQEFLQSKLTADIWMANIYSDVLSQTGGSVYVPEGQATDPNRIFNSTLTYNKGGALLHMIRNIIENDEVFFSVIKNYQQEFSNRNATGEDFKNFLESETGVEFDEFFNDWYYGEGYPSFRVEWNHHNDSLFVLQKQTTSHASVNFFEGPVDYRVTFSDGTYDTIRLVALNAIDTMQVYTSKVVTQVMVDPSKWLLKKVLSVTKNTNLVGAPDPDPVLGVEDKLKDQFDIYPNPVNDQFIIATEKAGYTFQLLDVRGSVRFTSQPLSGVQPINREELPAGIYVLRIYCDGQTLSQKIKLD